MSGNNPGDGSQNPKNPTPPSVPRGSGSKREKEVARLKAERQAARRAEREAAQKRKAIWGGVIAVVVAAVVIAVIAWAPWSSGTNTVTPTPTPTVASPTPSATASVADCTPAPTPRADNMSFKTPPPYSLTSGTVLTLSTNCGAIVIQTEPVKAPQTTKAMLGLAQAGYFNLTKCHRLTTSGIYVLQCGDPKGDGTGGPGFTLPEENLPKAGTNNYPAGTVAMARTSAKHSGGSQFFLVYQDTTLSPDYTIWGHITSGLSKLQAIAAAGTDNANQQGDGHPNQPVVIVTATTGKK